MVRCSQKSIVSPTLYKALILILGLNVTFFFSASSQDNFEESSITENLQEKGTGELLQLAVTASEKGNINQSLSYLNILLGQADEPETDLTRAMVLQRDLYFDLQSYSKSIEIHRRIDWNTIPDYWESVVPDHFISKVNFETENYASAVSGFKTASAQLISNGFNENGFQSQLLLAESYLNLRHQDSALLTLDEANSTLASVQGNRTELLSAHLRSAKASVFLAQGEYLLAIPLLKADSGYYLHDANQVEVASSGIYSVLQLSKALIEVGQLELARSTLSRAERLLELNPDPELFQVLLRYRIRLYENANQLDSAYALTKGYVAMWDLLLQNRSREKSLSQQIAFQSILEEERIAQAAIQSAVIAEGERERNRLLILVSIIILVGASVVLIVYFFYRRLVKEGEKLEAASHELRIKSAQLEKTLHEKETLMKEVHHRVKNNLQMISSLFFIQSKNVSDPIAKSVINEGQARVQAMASIHQKLYDSDTLDEIDMRSHFNSLCQQIIASYSPTGSKIKLNLKASEVNLNVDKALPLSLIVNELISNSMKHAFSNGETGEINIQLKSEDSELFMEYNDSGGGFQLSEDSEKQGIGLKLIQLLSSQLKAKLGHKENDASFIIRVPLN